ncbi:MAG TPA: hypothetical protein VGT04_11345 [Acidobacteriaceae bacterium]|nr:hypothetical protein [Acidobacteriaceae bacterium]
MSSPASLNSNKEQQKANAFEFPPNCYTGIKGKIQQFVGVAPSKPFAEIPRKLFRINDLGKDAFPETLLKSMNYSEKASWEPFVFK